MWDADNSAECVRVCVILPLTHNGPGQLFTQAEGVRHCLTHNKCMFAKKPNRSANDAQIDVKSSGTPEHARFLLAIVLLSCGCYRYS